MLALAVQSSNASIIAPFGTADWDGFALPDSRCRSVRLPMENDRLNKVLRREWQCLADDIAREDPDGSDVDMNELRVHAQQRANEYAKRIEKPVIDSEWMFLFRSN
jgi:hypothetical protein